MVNAHFAAGIPNSHMLELNQTFNPLKEDVFKEPLVVINSYADVPDKPGLGLEIIDDADKKFPYDPKNHWLETQKLDLEKEEELKGKLIVECEQLASEHKLSKESKTYNVLLTEVIEMLAMRLTMLSLMESVPDDLEPVPIK